MTVLLPAIPSSSQIQPSIMTVLFGMLLSMLRLASNLSVIRRPILSSGLIFDSQIDLCVVIITVSP
jgi:hypothetical protein